MVLSTLTFWGMPCDRPQPALAAGAGVGVPGGVSGVPVAGGVPAMPPAAAPALSTPPPLPMPLVGCPCSLPGVGRVAPGAAVPPGVAGVLLAGAAGALGAAGVPVKAGPSGAL